MIKDNSYENRLNAIKNGENVPEQTNPEYRWAPQIPNDQKVEKISVLNEILIDIYKNLSRTLGVLMASGLYGFGLEAIFNQDWSIFQIFGIGLLFNHAFTNMIPIIKKLFYKKPL